MKRKLSLQAFIFSQIIIFLVGLAFIGSLYLILREPEKSASNTISKPVTAAPASLTLDLADPLDELLIFDSFVTFSGKTAPQLPVLISSQTNNVIVMSSKTGTFTTEFELEPGVNEIKIIVFDKNGEDRQLERTIYYSKEKI